METTLNIGLKGKTVGSIPVSFDTAISEGEIFIYGTTRLYTGHQKPTVVYIGFSSTGPRRPNSHLKYPENLPRKFRNCLLSAKRKGEPLSWVVIARGYTDAKDGFASEQNWIATVGLENLCNQTLGGEGTIGFKPSKKTRRKMSAAKTGKKPTDETRAKLSANNAARRPEVRAKMSANAAARRPEVRAKISAANTGKTLNDETRAKISAAHTGRDSPMRGKRHTSEALARISASLTGKLTGADSPRARAVICLNDMKVYPTGREAASNYGGSSMSVSRVCQGKQKQTKGGFRFAYADALPEAAE